MHFKSPNRDPRRSVLRRPAVWLLVAALGAFVVAQRLLIVSEPALLVSKPPPVPAVSTSPFLNTTPAAGYVGVEACRRCHPQQHQTYLATTHSRSMSVVDPGRPIEPPGQVSHPASNRRYEIDLSETGLRHREFLAVPGQDELLLTQFSMQYRIGSGKVAHTYAADDEGFLVESPVTWYAAQQRWDMSPGFDKPQHSSFQRSVNQDCLYCHTGRVTAAESSRERLTIHELAISCERCHGPGSLHVQRHEARQTASDIASFQTPDETIVNPKRLSRELNEAICQQCHLMGEARVIPRGQQAENFRPGLPLTEYRLEFRLADSDDDEMSVVGHVEQMHLSRCYQSSETFTCTTCHDPHNAPAAGQRTAYFNAKCQECHTSADCSAPLSDRTVVQDNCLECHMPRVPTDVPHVAFTQHRVGIHTGRNAAPEKSGRRQLISLLAQPDLTDAENQRTLGLAYWNLYVQHADDSSYRDCLTEAFQHLEQAYEAEIRDPEVLATLAAIALGTGDVEQAQVLCRTALKDHVPGGLRADLQSGLAMTLYRLERFADAEEQYSQVTTMRRDASDWYLLGKCFEHQGQLQRAVNAYERALDIDPSSVTVRRQAAAACSLLNDETAARRHITISQRLEATQDSASDGGLEPRGGTR